MLLIIFLTGFLVVSALRFNAGVLFVIIALPLYIIRFSVFSLPSTLLELMIFSLAGVWIFRKTRQNEWKNFFHLWWQQKSGRVLLLSIVFVLVCATVGIIVSPEKLAALGVWRAYFIEPVLFFFILSDILKNLTIVKSVMLASILSAFSIACVAIYQRVTGWGIPHDWVSEMRVTSIFPYPNAVGLYVAPIMPLVFGVLAFVRAAAYSRKTKMLIALFGCIVSISMIAAIVFSQTEAALIALAVSGILFLFFWGIPTRRFALSCIVLFFLALTISQPFSEFFSQKIFLQDWSGKVRRGIWKETANMLQDHWLFGAGLSGYKTVFEPYHTRAYIEIFQYPHSLVLNFWSEIGLFGLFSIIILIGIFFFFILTTLRRARRLPRSDDPTFFYAVSLAFLCSMITILIHGLVDVPYFKNDLAVFFWVLLALSLSVYRQIEKT